jgi:polyisoprenyl-phosphate glycosyltransferase
MQCRQNPILLSLVIPLFNEEASFPALKPAIEEWRKTLDYPVEIVLVDDGSSDTTRPQIKAWAITDPSVKGILLSRNFGHQTALTAGLAACSGDVIAIIDADLQDPLEIIPSMVEKYCMGFDVVYGKRARRSGENRFKRFTAWLFYRLLRLMTDTDIPVDAGDFRVLSRRCLDELLKMNEMHRFLRGMITWVGFPQTYVDYERRPRISGKTKYSLIRMIHFALNGIVSFSTLPIRIISFSGVMVSLFGVVYGAYSVARYFFMGDTAKGWPTIIVILCMMGGMVLISLGVIGEYVARIFEEIKCRPLYVVEERLNIREHL